jgi:DNA-binding XRE family transcriptional regulator
MDSRPDNKAAIAGRFRTLRQSVILSQSHLGSIIDICRQSINEIENQHVMPHCATWDKFCRLEADHSRARTVRLPEHWFCDSNTDCERQQKAT